MNVIKITPVQLTLAQLGAEVELDTGHTLHAVPVMDGWKYIMSLGGQVALVRYARNGLQEAVRVLNAPHPDVVWWV